MSPSDHTLLYSAQDEAEARALVVRVDAAPPVHSPARRHERAFTLLLVAAFALCIGFVAGTGFAVLTIAAER